MALRGIRQSFSRLLLELGVGISKSDVQFSCSFHNAGPKVGQIEFYYLFLAEMLFAISPANLRLFISSSSMSFSFLITNFLNPFGRRNLVFLFEPNPIPGMTTDPKNFLRTLLSIPCGFLQEV